MTDFEIQEFAALNSSSNIYKLVGPVLLKQERTEAEQAVKARLEFIASEIKRVEKQIMEMQEQGEAKKMEVNVTREGAWPRANVLFGRGRISDSSSSTQVFELQSQMQPATSA